MALTANQYDHVLTWLKYCRIMSADTHRRNAKRLDMDPQLKAELLKEQARRVAEIRKLERAVQREIDALTAEGEGGRGIMPRRNHRPQHTSMKQRRSAAEQEAHRREIAESGGWYLWHRSQREQREQAQQGRQNKGR